MHNPRTILQGLGLTRISFVQNYLAVAGFQSCLADSLQAELDAAAGLQVRQGELKRVVPEPQADLVPDVVCAVQVEDCEEEE